MDYEEIYLRIDDLFREIVFGEMDDSERRNMCIKVERLNNTTKGILEARAKFPYPSDAEASEVVKKIARKEETDTARRGSGPVLASRSRAIKLTYDSPRVEIEGYEQ
jgi:hypothetical protein